MNEEKTAVLYVGDWVSQCSACMGNADPNDTHHTHGGPGSMYDRNSHLDKTNGCGARFVDKVRV